MQSVKEFQERMTMSFEPTEALVVAIAAALRSEFVRGLEVALSKLETGGFQGPTLNYILMFRRHIQAEIDKAKAGK